jgi:hypothetical protein
MLRRIIQSSPFAGLLGMAATYSLATTLGVVFVADRLARAPSCSHRFNGDGCWSLLRSLVEWVQ